VLMALDLERTRAFPMNSPDIRLIQKKEIKP